MSTINLNLEAAQQHVSLLTGKPDAQVCVRLIHDSDKKQPAVKLEGSIEQLWPEITRYQSEGYGAFVIVNAGGNNDQEIDNILAVFVDGDDVPLPEQWHATPDFLVTRDETHWHAYWLIDALPVAEFREAQLRLAALYGTDTKVCNPSRIMRLAGTLHQKAVDNPKLIQLQTIREEWEGYRTPQELIAPLPAPDVKNSVKAQAADDVVLDTPPNIERATRMLNSYVSSGHVAVEGAGGDNLTFQVFCEVQNLGLSPDKSLEIIEEIWNPNCLPPWTHEELRIKADNAGTYAQNDAGAWAVAPATETFKEALGRLPLDADEPERRSRFYFEDDEEQDLAPDPTWLVPDLVPDNSTVLVVGSTGSFKSFLTEDIMLAVAAGAETFGTKPLRAGPTFYGAHEGRNAIKKARKRAWKAARGIEGTIPFYVAPAPQVASQEQCDDFREQIRFRLRQSNAKIGAIVLDTVAKCMVGLNENDARDCGVFIAFCDSLRDEFECAVLALHHFGKDAGKGGRGSSALPAGFDTILHVTREAGTKAVSLKVEQHKDADENEKPWTFEGRPFAGSLVFFPTTEDEHRILTGKNDDISNPRKVGAALQALNAKGNDNAVTTRVLAMQLMPIEQNQTTEAHQSIIEKTAKTLKGLARSKLEAYCEKEGKDFMWFLP